MIQQTSLNLKCQEDNHKEKIGFICYNEFCTGFRLNCFDCFKRGIHHTHFDDVKQVNSLIPFIESNNKECDNFIDDLKKYLQSLNQSFSQLTQGIRNKYTLVKERLVNMNSNKINDYLNSTIKLIEYKQSISQIIQEQIKKINHSFNNLYEQLQLSSFNYHQIDDNDVKIAYDLRNYGQKLYQDLKFNEALEQLDKSISINPNNEESLCYKGASLRMLDKYQDAIIWLDKALAINPKHVFSEWNKGECLRMLGKYEDAITWLDKAQAIDPKHVFSLGRKGECLRQLKQYDKSQKVLHQAISLNPNHKFSLDSLGACLQDQQKYQEALIYYEKSLKVESNSEWTKNQKKICEQKLKK